MLSRFMQTKIEGMRSEPAEQPKYSPVAQSMEMQQQHGLYVETNRADADNQREQQQQQQSGPYRPSALPQTYQERQQQTPSSM